MKKHKKFDFRHFKETLPYILTGIVTLTAVFVGSLDKKDAGTTLSLNAFAATDYKVSVDQLSELYMVADLSDILGLASASDVASNFVVTTSMYDAGQTSSGKLEKPNITNLPVNRKVIEYHVVDGDSMDSIAAKFKVTTDQIRWSNGLKNTDISVGDTLYIPSVPGIVYTVKEGESIEEIASRYGSNATEIIALNDLEVSGVSEGMKIIIKGGELPETERPEYVPPVRTYTYTYLGSTAGRMNLSVVGYMYGLGGPYVAGQCTQYAWYRRQDLPSNLGNARDWARNAAAAGYAVDNTPAPGAVFQSSSGWYGHVGYVEYQNADGSWHVSEMNYNYRPFMVVESDLPASSAANLNYIH